ncbi:hypothetical protein B484DRAFT_459704 [Ochromonadaceae sp. CCMP2298]|nr:hypothetical protein B484DRAFT_459704 [Ochromonadaceae sp. CCMP2298]
MRLHLYLHLRLLHCPRLLTWPSGGTAWGTFSYSRSLECGTHSPHTHIHTHIHMPHLHPHLHLHLHQNRHLHLQAGCVLGT